MFVLVSGTLHRAAVARQSKSGKSYVTALLRTGTPETLWVNVVAFDLAAQSELLRLAPGDCLAAQGSAKLDVYQAKDGAWRPSLEVIVTHVLALRRPRRPPPVKEAPPTAPEFDDALPF